MNKKKITPYHRTLLKTCNLLLLKDTCKYTCYHFAGKCKTTLQYSTYQHNTSFYSNKVTKQKQKRN